MEKRTKFKILLAIILFLCLVVFLIFTSRECYKDKQKIVEEKAKEDASIEEIKAWNKYENHLEIIKFNESYGVEKENIIKDENDGIKRIVTSLEFKEVEYEGEVKPNYRIGLNNYSCIYFSFKNKIIWVIGFYAEGDNSASYTRYYKISDDNFLLMENSLNNLYQL